MRSLNVVLLLVALSAAAYATKGHKGRNNNSGGGYGGSYGGGHSSYGGGHSSYGGGYGGGMQNGYRSSPTMQSGYYGHQMQNQQHYGNQMHYGNQQYYGNQMQSQYYASPVQNQYYGNQLQGQYVGNQMMGQYYGNPMLQQQNAGLYNGFGMNQGVYGNQQLSYSPALGGQQWVNNGVQGNLYGQQLAMQSSLVQPVYQNSYLGQGINTAGSGNVPTFTDLGGNSYGQTVLI